MLNEYIEHKLKLKVTTHLRLAGLNTIVDISTLVEKVKDLGDYKITWKEITNELLNLKLDKLVLLLEKFYDSAKSMISIMM